MAHSILRSSWVRKRGDKSEIMNGYLLCKMRRKKEREGATKKKRPVGKHRQAHVAGATCIIGPTAKKTPCFSGAKAWGVGGASTCSGWVGVNRVNFLTTTSCFASLPVSGQPDSHTVKKT